MLALRSLKQIVSNLPIRCPPNGARSQQRRALSNHTKTALNFSQITSLYKVDIQASLRVDDTVVVWLLQNHQARMDTVAVQDQLLPLIYQKSGPFCP